jgi:hypothetical protein
MRHLSYVLCASIAACGYSALATAITNPPLAVTLDLLGPCTPSGCGGAIHPTDIGLNLAATSFSYAPGPGSSYVTTLGITTPVVCDEISSTHVLGATSALRVAPTFNNSAPGGLLEFNAGGTSVVDLNAMTYDGSSPSGVAASYNNYGGTLPPQVVCYRINPVSGGPLVLAAGPYGLFADGFDTGHVASEPWVSVQTIISPTSGAGSSPAGFTSSSSTPSDFTPSNRMAYVVQIHNAANAVGWRLSLGYDYALFDPVNNGNQSAGWCVIATTQPSASGNCGTMHGLGTSYTISAADVQSTTNSAYVYVQHYASAAAATNWTSLTASLYPAVAAIFPPFGTYPQRFDDKVAVVSANNLPALNIGNIVCNNDTTSTACVISDQNGNAVPAALTFANAISGGGTVNIDPLAYFVDPSGGATLPGNVAADVLTVSGVSCVDPSGILASPIVNGNFTTSPSAQGGKALGFGFKPAGSLYVAGTASCTATFATSGDAALPLSATGSFTITMLPPTVSHFAVSAPPGATAGAAFNVTVTAQDGGNNTVAAYSGTVHFTSTDGAAVLPANTTLTNGVGTFSSTLKTSGSRTITATDTVSSSVTGTSGTIAVAAGAATHFSVNAPASATSAVAFNISVTALDQFNNTATGYGGTVHYSSTDAAAVLPADQTLTFGVGTPSVTLVTPPSQTVTATDTVTSTITGTSSSITVN